MNIKILIGLTSALLAAITAYYNYAKPKEASIVNIENSNISTECSPNISNIKASGSITINNSGCSKK